MATLSDYYEALTNFEGINFTNFNDLDNSYKALDSLMREVEPESDRLSAIVAHSRANSHHLNTTNKISGHK